MAGLVRVRLIPGAVRKLMLSSGVAKDLERRGRAIAAAAGPGHRVEIDPTPNRARVAVITDTFEARHAEATSRNLTRAIDAGRR